MSEQLFIRRVIFGLWSTCWIWLSERLSGHIIRGWGIHKLVLALLKSILLLGQSLSRLVIVLVVRISHNGITSITVSHHHVVVTWSSLQLILQGWAIHNACSAFGEDVGSLRLRCVWLSHRLIREESTVISHVPSSIHVTINFSLYLGLKFSDLHVQSCFTVLHLPLYGLHLLSVLPLLGPQSLFKTRYSWSLHELDLLLELLDQALALVLFQLDLIKFCFYPFNFLTFI